MREAVVSVAAGIAFAAALSSSGTTSAADCAKVSPTEWVRGACAPEDLKAAFARRFPQESKARFAALCAGGTPERWLPGTWSLNQSTLIVSQDKDGFAWTFDRKEGQTSHVWGEKDPAKGEGRVVAIDGCKVELRGKYTAFEGHGAAGRNPIGWPMEYSMELISPDSLAGQGFGYGQRPFRILFNRMRS